MHEYTITCSIVKILEEIIKKNNIKKITRVNFELSPFAAIEPESVRFYFDFLTRNDKRLKEAGLEFEKKPVDFKCSDCGSVFILEKMEYRCPDCGSRNIRISDMEDLRIVSVETP